MSTKQEATVAGVSTRVARTPAMIGGGVVALILGGALLVWHAEAKTNKIALDDSPKPVTAVHAKGSSYRPTRRYVGTLRPWVEARVGPQFLSAYVDTVLVRPGAVVKRGEVLGTLDCRNASAETRAIAAQAKAIAANQKAIEHEAKRTEGLLDGGFVSPNEAEQKSAQSTSLAAQLAAQEATLAKSSLDVSDCTLRAPFDGEISRRMIDPGAFVRPGTEMLAVVDRGIVRMTADAPEDDFAVVTPDTSVRVHVLATNQDLEGKITRRAPSADPGTRTVHFEIDIPDPDRKIPVDTTGEIYVDVGQPVPATEIPLYAASVSGAKATVFVVDQEKAHARVVDVLGELKGSLFLRPEALPASALVVTEGRALLHDGEHVSTKVSDVTPRGASSTVVSQDTAP